LASRGIVSGKSLASHGGHGRGDSNSGPPREGLPGGGCAGGLTCDSLTRMATAGARWTPLPTGSVCTQACTGGFGPVGARTSPALRSSATRDRSAGRHGKADASLDHRPLIRKPAWALLPARMGNGVDRGRRGVVRDCPLETLQDCCERHSHGMAVRRPWCSLSHDSP
jgi:hypothetical protein